MRNAPLCRLEVDLDTLGSLLAKALAQAGRRLLGRRRNQQMAPAAVVLDPLVGETPRELTGFGKRVQVDPKLPFVPARGGRHAFLVCLVLAMLGGALGLALRPWRRRVHPLLGVGIPPGDPRRRLEAIAARQLARDALGLPRRVLTPGVQEHPGAVPGDDHPIAEALSRLVIEVEGSQPVAKRQAMALVLQM